VAGAATLSGSSNSSMMFDLNGTANAADKLAITGAVTNGSGVDIITVNNLGLGSPTVGSAYTIITAASGLGDADYALGTTKLTIGATTYGLSLSTSTATSEIVTLTALTGLNAAYWTGNQGAVWSNTTGGGVSLATNWSTSSTGSPDAQAQPTTVTDVYFTATGATNLTETLGANYSLNSLNFTSGAGAVTIGASNTLTLGAGGLNVPSGSAAQTLNVYTVLGSPQTWTNGSANAFTQGGEVNTNGLALTTAGSGNFAFNGVVAGSGSLALTGTGTVTLAGANTYTGETTVASGSTLSLTGSIGNGSPGGSAMTTAGTFAETSAGAIYGASSLTVSGGTATLAGLNTYSGATNINGGTVSLTGDLAGTSGVTVNGSSAALNESSAGSIGRRRLHLDPPVRPLCSAPTLTPGPRPSAPARPSMRATPVRWAMAAP
jgi:fibronectin-binding autotransporter adhesin